MKLKTLNDLNVGICSSFNIISKGKQCDDKDCISCGYARELKQEAIKWVKEIYPLIKTARIKNIDENNVIEWSYSGKRTEMDLFRMGQVSILIKVNNITKEHLK